MGAVGTFGEMRSSPADCPNHHADVLIPLNIPKRNTCGCTTRVARVAIRRRPDDVPERSTVLLGIPSCGSC